MDWASLDVLNMEEVNFEDFCRRKAFEVAYALFRLGDMQHSASFKIQLEERGVRIIAESGDGDWSRLLKTSKVVEDLINLGSSVNLISVPNGQLVINELKYLNAAISEYGNAAKLPDRDLRPIFSELRVKDGRSAVKENDFDLAGFYKGQSSIIDDELDSEVIVDEEEAIDNPANEEHNPAIAGSQSGNQTRQLEILEKIRQSQSSRFKDIQETFPTISERTIRYDIQKLIENGLVERVGSGGPATFYRATSVA